MKTYTCLNCLAPFEVPFYQSVCLPCQTDIANFLEDESYWEELAAELSEDR